MEIAVPLLTYKRHEDRVAYTIWINPPPIPIPAHEKRRGQITYTITVSLPPPAALNSYTDTASLSKTPSAP
jgi:uncharacterized lipoprotein YbaY